MGTYNDMPQFNYNDRSRSIIVTGCQPWTVYQYTNYQGRAMCLFPSDTSLCTPGLYPTSSNLGSLAGDVSSARRGCYAKGKFTQSILVSSLVQDLRRVSSHLIN